MTATRSSGLTSLRMNAAAPALMASNRSSSSSFEASTMIETAGNSRLIRCVVSMPPGARQREVHEDDVGRRLEARSIALAAVVRLADDLEVLSPREDLGDAHAEEDMVVDDEDPRSLHVSPPPALRPGVLHRAHVLSFAAPGIVILTMVPPSGRGSYVRSGTDQLRPLAHELQSEVPPCAARRPRRVEPASVVADLDDPSPAHHRLVDASAATPAVLSNVLQRLLDDAQDDRLLPSPADRGRRDGSRSPRSIERGAALLGDVTDGAVQTKIGQNRGAELADEGADVAQLASGASRRNRQLVPRPASGRCSRSRSMYSTWKIAFERAWAGPSWTSWASRARSASWASTMRIWTPAEPGAPGPPPTAPSTASLRRPRRPSPLESPISVGIAPLEEEQPRRFRGCAARPRSGPGPCGVPPGRRPQYRAIARNAIAASG